MKRLTQTLQRQIRGELVKIARSVKEVLADDGVRLRMRPPRKRDLIPRDGGTGGFWLSVGRLSSKVYVDLWLDHFTGLSSPHVWMGFSAFSRGPIERLVKLARFAGFNYKPIRLTSRQVTSRKPYNLTKPLSEDQFERLVYEAYASDTHFLGIYKKYTWPISPRHRIAIANELGNLVGRFSAALADARHDNGVALRTLGPWARPDKRIEKAAVKFVRRKLIRERYKVESHEDVICGYDLYAVRDRTRRYIEVKGCAGAEPRFFISRTELRAARIKPLWELAIVTNAGSREAKLECLLSGREMERQFRLEPIQWEGLPRKNIR